MNDTLPDAHFDGPAPGFNLWGSVLFLTLVVSVLTATAFYHYLLFHSLVEFVSISIAFTLFIISWNSRQFLGRTSLNLLGLAYLAIGTLDLLHTLSYQGMTVFPVERDYATQLWIASRYLESISLLAAFLLAKRKIPSTPILALLATTVTLILLSIFAWRIFPACFVGGEGLTPFKIWSEYIISSILLAGLVLLHRNRDLYEPIVYRFLAASILLTVASELSFTLYIDRYGLFNQLGHYLKLASFYFIYKAVVETGIRRPYATVFRDLLLQREELKEARRAAEQANRAKSDFLAHMSHEIRTPIGGIIGLTDLVLPRISDPQNREYLQLIRESTQTLLTIVGDILDLSRIESGKAEARYVGFHLPGELEKQVSLHTVSARRKGLDLSLRFAENVPSHVKGDPDMLGQVLRNLVTNAIKYTEKGSVSLEVSIRTAAREENGAEQVVFAVIDTGIGIPEEDMRLLFRSFTRLHGHGSAAPAEGTGLGLAISARLTELMGGKIEVRSESGVGSVFSLVLPLQRVEPESIAADDDGTEENGLELLPPLRILVAEDNRINQVFLKGALEKAGHRVTVVDNGADTVRAVTEEEERFDLVLMDVQMPIMDGMEATRRIRATENGRSGIPIIALTAFAMKGDAEKFLDSGMDGYITKPVSFDRLAGEIRRLVFPG